METKKLPINGMVRRPKNRMSEDGDCAEIVNLRYKEGAWTPVGKKKEIEELPDDATNIVFHLINDKWEAYGYEYNGDVKAKIINKTEESSNTVTLVSTDSENIIIKPFYNVLLVGTNEKFTAFIFNVQDGEYEEKTTSIPYDFFNLKSFNFVTSKLATEEANSAPQDASELDYFYAFIEEVEKIGFFVGPVFMAVGIKLSNGDIVKITPFRFFKNTSMLFADGNDSAAEQMGLLRAFALEVKDDYSLDDIKEWSDIINSFVILSSKPTQFTGNYEKHPAYPKSKEEATKYIDGFVDFFPDLPQTIIDEFSTDHTGTDEKWGYYSPAFEKAKMQGTSNFRVVAEFSMNEIGNDSISLNKTTPGNLDDHYYHPYFWWCDSEKLKNDEQFIRNRTRLSTTVSDYDHYSDDQIEKIETISGLTVFKIDDAANFDSLPGVELSINPHDVIPLNPISTYNQRIVLPGIRNILTKDVPPEFCLRQNELHSEVDVETANADSDNYDPYLVYDRNWEKDGVLQKYHISVFFRIKTNAGEKVVQSKETTETTFSASHYDLKVFVGNLIYPDTRAEEAILYIRVNPDYNYSISEQANLIKTFKMRPHDFLNISVAEVNQILSHKWESDEYSSDETVSDRPWSTMTDGDFDSVQESDLPAEDRTYKDLNRVQASASGTVFSFPAKYSYRVGMDEVLNVTAITDELSQGQFGQFPLIAFTKGMIWAMEIGESDVFISNIVPLANEICNNPDSITVAQKGVVFSTNEGLKILQGEKPQEFSEIIEGKADRLPINGQFTLNTILSRNGMENMVDGTDFKEFIKNAIVGYDSYWEEIIISNTDYDYSFVFSMRKDNANWTKISQVFHGFINQFPFNFGIKTEDDVTKVVDLANEKEQSSVKTLVITRPFHLERDVYKKLEKSAVRGILINSNAYLFAATEGERYNLVSTGKATDYMKQIFLHRVNYSAKSFVLVIVSEMTPDEYISELDFSYTPRFATKIR